MTAVLMCIMAFAVGATVPEKPTLDVDFGEVTEIDGFDAPSYYFSTSERVLLSDGNGGYATYPTYYVTRNSTTFDFDFTMLNRALGTTYSKASVVMVEIPAGITTISNSYFAGTSSFPLCEYVQFPGTVTSYGASLFAGYNSVIRVVEFLDGTEPITMGDSMFGSKWNGGTTNLQYVKFPNNLVSIGNYTFGMSHQDKVIILGESLESIGTNFLGESTPSDKDTHIYVSNNFFSNTEMFENLFGGYYKYHNGTLRLTVFYVGEYDEAEAFVEKGKNVQSGYVFDNVTFVSADEYDSEANKPTVDKSMVMVYGVSGCDAFYGGEHELYGYDYILDDDVFSEIRLGEVCQRCRAEFVKETKAPMLVWLGYSTMDYGRGTSVVQGYRVDQEAIQYYECYSGYSLELGTVAFINSNGAPVPAPSNAWEWEPWVVTTVVERFAMGFDIRVSGFSDEYSDTRIVFCAYIRIDDEVWYLDDGVMATSVLGKTYDEIMDTFG